MAKEVWKAVAGYEGKYEVSNMGRIRSLFYNKIRRLCLNNGYPSVTFDVKGMRTKCFRVHRLVAAAFVKNPNKHEDIDHVNNNRMDNRAENLEWVTHKENADRYHAITRGKRIAMYKLIPSEIPKIRALFGIFSCTKIGKLFGVKGPTIYDIKKGRTWKGF